MQRVPERRRRVGTVASYYSEYFPRTTYHISFFSPGSISFLLYFSFCFARVFPSGDTDARPVCRPNPFPLGTPSPHCGATSAGRYPPAVAHISAPLFLAPNPPRLGPGGPRDLRLFSCRSARPTCVRGRTLRTFCIRAGYGAFSPRRPIFTAFIISAFLLVSLPPDTRDPLKTPFARFERFSIL